MGVCPLFLSGRSSRVGAWANWNKLTGQSFNQTQSRRSQSRLQPIRARGGRYPSPNFTRRHRLKTKPRWNLPVWTGFNRLRVSCLREERRRRHTTSTPPRWKIIRVTILLVNQGLLCFVKCIGVTYCRVCRDCSFWIHISGSYQPDITHTAGAGDRESQRCRNRKSFQTISDTQVLTISCSFFGKRHSFQSEPRTLGR